MNIEKKGNLNTGYVDRNYLEKISEVLLPLKLCSFDHMHLKPGNTVLDLGCGPGIDTISLGKLVGKNGQVIGIDNDENMIKNASIKAKSLAMEDYVIHHHAEAESLPYANNYFDSCRSERLFQHLLNPVQVLSELKRVTKKEGWIVVADLDHSTVSIDTPHKEIEWRLRYVLTNMVNNGNAGRQLYRLFKEQNLTDIKVEIFPHYTLDYNVAKHLGLFDRISLKVLELGLVSEKELDDFYKNLELSHHRETFFTSSNMVLVAGRKIC